MIVYIFGIYASKVVCAYMFFSDASILNMFGAFLHVATWLTLLVLDLVLNLCALFYSLRCHFFADNSLPGLHGDASLVCPFLFFQFIVGNFPIFSVTVKFLLG